MTSPPRQARDAVRQAASTAARAPSRRWPSRHEPDRIPGRSRPLGPLLAAIDVPPGPRLCNPQRRTRHEAGHKGAVRRHVVPRHVGSPRPVPFDRPPTCRASTIRETRMFGKGYPIRFHTASPNRHVRCIFPINRARLFDSCSATYPLLVGLRPSTRARATSQREGLALAFDHALQFQERRLGADHMSLQTGDADEVVERAGFGERFDECFLRLG